MRSLLGESATSLSTLAAAIARAASGAIYDPSDLTSLYQSRTGGSTGATGQSVGIMLDKSYMGGRTAAAYIAGQADALGGAGSFASATGWSGDTGNITGGAFAVTNTFLGINYAGAGIVAGSWYVTTLDVTKTGNGTLYVYYGSASAQVAAITATGSYTVVAPAPAGANSSFRLYVDTSAVGTISVDNAVVKAIPGFHALAPTDAARSLLTVASGLAYLTADGVDDWMNVTPTLDLGQTWWHVGGWRSDTNVRWPFATGTLAKTSFPVFTTATAGWRANNNADLTYDIIAAGDPTAVHVATIERASNAAISGRFNGGGSSSIDPYNNSGTLGLALFSSVNASFNSGIAGRFYGGAFALGAITTADRATMERYTAGLAGVTL